MRLQVKNMKGDVTVGFLLPRVLHAMAVDCRLKRLGPKDVTQIAPSLIVFFPSPAIRGRAHLAFS